MLPVVRLFLVPFLFIAFSSFSAEHAESNAPVGRAINPGAGAKASGLSFSCSPEKLKKVEAEMAELFKAYDIEPTLFSKRGSVDSGHLIFTLNTPETDTKTYDFHKRPEYRLKDEKLNLSYGDGDFREVSVVSKKEILLALLQHGRLTQFNDEACSVEALKDHIGVRQSIAAWVEHTFWYWPDDNKPGATSWNYDLWNRNGTPKAGVPLHKAFADVFTNARKYAPFCYTASKLAYTHGILDYYQNVKKDPKMVKELEDRLMANGDPLEYLDPDLDVDNAYIVGTDKPVRDATRITKPGKFVGATFKVSPDNFIPGDWAYFLNTDVRSSNIKGYEGSNSIYLGRDKFDDYYYEHRGSFTKKEKLDEIYLWQWEGINPKPKVEVTDAMREKMNRTPEEGGIVENFRWIPHYFGAGPLPEIK